MFLNITHLIKNDFTANSISTISGDYFLIRHAEYSLFRANPSHPISH